jgi:hypothetical protein
VREYWGINAQTLRTTVHREQKEAGYGLVFTAGPADTLKAGFAPEIDVALQSLRLA